MRQRVDGGEDQATQDGDPEALHGEALDNAREEPEQEAVDDEGEDTEGKKIDWQRENCQDRLDRDIHKPPKECEDERCPETLD